MSIARTILIRSGSYPNFPDIRPEDMPVRKRWSNGTSAKLTFRDGSVLNLYRGKVDCAYGGTDPEYPRDIIDLVAPDRVYRIRRCSSEGGGAQQFYHHADVIAASAREALEAAQDFRVTNWRTLDRFDSSDEPYLYFELLRGVEPHEVKKPARPLAARPAADHGKTVTEVASYLQAGARNVEDIAEPPEFAELWRRESLESCD